MVKGMLGGEGGKLGAGMGRQAHHNRAGHAQFRARSLSTHDSSEDLNLGGSGPPPRTREGKK